MKTGEKQIMKFDQLFIYINFLINAYSTIVI